GRFGRVRARVLDTFRTQLSLGPLGREDPLLRGEARGDCGLVARALLNPRRLPSGLVGSCRRLPSRRWTSKPSPRPALPVDPPSQPIRLRVLNALARLFGVSALLVGGFGVWCGLTLREDRWLNLGIGGFTFVIGCAFLVTKPVTREHLDQVFGGLHKDS